MSQTSPRLALPYLQPAQAQKHVTHNEALMILDALLQLVLEEVDATLPPASPAAGAAYGLGTGPTGPTGAWDGQAGQLAIWQGEGWLFLRPQVGWHAWDRASATLRHWDGSAWIQADQVAQWGISTTADATNRLAVAADATLLTHAGAGHQLKLNKSTPAETASLLFQSGFTGHAEIGLAGSNDLSVKVSGDGSNWQQALVMRADTGHMGLGAAAPAARLELQSLAGEDLLLAGDGSALFRLGADGNGTCAGAWSGGGADYAEYMEWEDGNPEGADRRGLAVVVLSGGTIRPAHPGETPIGVISASPCVIGNDDGGSWQGRWLRDAFGAVRRDGQGRRLERADFDPDRAYLPRSARPEWALVGLVGRLRLRAGQPVDPRWVRIGPAGEGLEDWLLR